jgi:hypothetical protein
MLNEAVDENKGSAVCSARRSPRICLQIPVFVRGRDASGSEFIQLTKTLNISAVGACITCEHPLRLFQTIQLTIPAPSPATDGLVPSQTPPIIARVVRQNLLGATRLFGVEFVHPLE